MRRALLAFVLLLVVGLGGCAGVLGGDQPLPPGVTASGVQNATALADAHEDHLRSGYRVERSTTVTATNGTVLQRTESTTRWTADERIRTISYSAEHPALGVEADVYDNESGTWVRVRLASGNTSVRRADGGAWRGLLPGPGGEWEQVYALAAASNTNVTTADDGTTRISFTDDGYHRGTANGTLMVRADGLVTHYESTYEGSWRGKPVTVHEVQNYSHVGSPGVDEPDWLLNATN